MGGGGGGEGHAYGAVGRKGRRSIPRDSKTGAQRGKAPACCCAGSKAWARSAGGAAPVVSTIVLARTRTRTNCALACRVGFWGAPLLAARTLGPGPGTNPTPTPRRRLQATARTACCAPAMRSRAARTAAKSASGGRATAGPIAAAAGVWWGGFGGRLAVLLPWKNAELMPTHPCAAQRRRLHQHRVHLLPR